MSTLANLSKIYERAMLEEEVAMSKARRVSLLIIKHIANAIAEGYKITEGELKGKEVKPGDRMCITRSEGPAFLGIFTIDDEVQCVSLWIDAEGNINSCLQRECQP